MIRTKAIAVAVATMSLLPLTAHAGGLVGVGPVKIAKLSPQSAGAVWVELSTQVSCASAGGSSTPSSSVLLAEGADFSPLEGVLTLRAFENIYAALLSALLSNKDVTLVIGPSQGTTTCFIERITIHQ